MAEKAILVTEENQERLNNRFYQEGPGVPMAIGYFLVAGFGEDGDYDMMSPARFYEKYSRGTPITNGFFEAIPKAVP